MSDRAHLTLRLEGPLQSWGSESQFNRRQTNPLPTKSALLGMCCAAMRLGKGSPEEKAKLPALAKLGCLVIALNRPDSQYPTRRLEDYHTVQHTRTADGKTKETHLTRRDYLTDARFAAILSGDAALLKEIAAALADPQWGIWLGRKACIPSAPVLAGIRADEDVSLALRKTEAEALALVLDGEPLTAFTRQREVATFAEGNDTLRDQPLSFVTPRDFSPRRVKLWRAGEPEKSHYSELQNNADQAE